MTIRATEYIPYATAINAMHGRRFAEDSLGIDLNNMLTVNWSLVGYLGYEAKCAQMELRKRVSRAWRYRQSKTQFCDFTYIECLESPNGNFHAHVLLYVPKGEEEWFLNLVESRVEKLVGQRLPKTMIDLTKVDHSGAVLKYLCKGVSPAYAEHLHLDTSPQGQVIGQRMSSSRAISTTARNRAGWKRKRRFSSLNR